jgi:endonuclease-3
MGAVLRVLEREYPEAECSLSFGSPFQLLCATILSAQCTDARVNLVTPALFAAYPGPREMAEAPLSKLEALVRTTGFFKNKALALREAARAIVANHGGEVPVALEDLVQLRGVGRKTANA